MFSRSITYFVLTSALMLAMGMGTGCQTPQMRSSDQRLSPLRISGAEHSRRPDLDEGNGLDDQLPETTSEPRYPFKTEPQPATPVVPESRPLPVPPADEFEALRSRSDWTPARPNGLTREFSPSEQFARAEDSDDSEFPPARVTYNTSEDSAGKTYQSTTISRPQPRLFRPAGTAKDLFETMKHTLP